VLNVHREVNGHARSHIPHPQLDAIRRKHEECDINRWASRSGTRRRKFLFFDFRAHSDTFDVTLDPFITRLEVVNANRSPPQAVQFAYRWALWISSYFQSSCHWSFCCAGAGYQSFAGALHVLPLPSQASHRSIFRQLTGS